MDQITTPAQEIHDIAAGNAPISSRDPYEQGRADAAALGLDVSAALRATDTPHVPVWVDQALAEWTQPAREYALDVDPDPFVPTCPAWCDKQPHTFEAHHEDRTHGSHHCAVSLELERAKRMPERVPSESYSRYELADVTAHLEQEYREVSPRVVLTPAGLGTTYLTVDEAERCARMLLALVSVARAGQGSDR